MKAKIRLLDHKGDTIHTRWGELVLDKDGLGELDVPEEELDMLRQTKPFPWLYEPAGGPPEPPALPPAESSGPGFDVSDETPLPGTKKPKQSSRR